MAFFQSPIVPKVSNPLSDLPGESKGCPENCTVTVREVKSVQSEGGWAGVVWEVEIQIDGQATPLHGKSGVGGVTSMLTVVNGDKTPLNELRVAQDCARLEQRFGAPYERAGHPFAKTPDQGFTLPGGFALSDDALGEALRSIEGVPFRAHCWTFTGKKGVGVDFYPAKPDAE